MIGQRRSSLACSPATVPSKRFPGVSRSDDLWRAAALDNYSRRPDCFRRVAGNIRLRCGELDMNEDERVRAAISMTLCELATATHHSIPLECASFAVDSEPAQVQGDCVDALSRSAQFWSSYSGYLREVRKYPQLCFAFRRWNDIGKQITWHFVGPSTHDSSQTRPGIFIKTP
ncbi:hypothetical protein K438DRAFT_1592842 [Mycena galopus ATCC 62051]|nr:hypothetical protein K438DRAFT_1592842 [Mycena galopus ATCC 62051]